MNVLGSRLPLAFAAKRRTAARPPAPANVRAQHEAPAGRFREPVAAPDPPRRHKWLLVLTSIALAAWLCFLLAMALSGV